MCKTHFGSNSRWFWNNFFSSKYPNGTWDPPPLRGKIYLKFPLWLFEPLPDMFSRGTSQQTIVFSCSSSQRLREQLHLIPNTLNNYCTSRPLMIISHWKNFLFFKINWCLLLSHHFLCLLVPWRRQTSDRHWELSTTWAEEYCSTKLMSTYVHKGALMSTLCTYEHLWELIGTY